MENIVKEKFVNVKSDENLNIKSSIPVVNNEKSGPEALGNFLDFTSDGILKGMIYSEIFGLPKSKRKGR